MSRVFLSFALVRTAAAACLLAAGLAACTAPVAGDAGQSPLRVFKSLGSVQCGGGGAAPADFVRELGSAGVEVRQAACGTDGRMYPAVCGGADGRIAILEIDDGDAGQAAGLGFKPLSTLPDAREVPCR